MGDMLRGIFTSKPTAMPSTSLPRPQMMNPVDRTRAPDENSFQQWYRGWANVSGIDPNPDNPQHHYDMRSAYLSGANPTIDPTDKRLHWPSPFKTDDHPNRFIQTKDGVLDTKTGRLIKMGQ